MASKSYIIDQDESIQDSIDEVANLLEKYSDSFIKKKVLRAMIQMYYGYQSNLDLQSLYYGVGTERSYLGGYYNYDGEKMVTKVNASSFSSHFNLLLRLILCCVQGNVSSVDGRL